MFGAKISIVGKYIYLKAQLFLINSHFKKKQKKPLIPQNTICFLECHKILFQSFFTSIFTSNK